MPGTTNDMIVIDGVCDKQYRTRMIQMKATHESTAVASSQALSLSIPTPSSSPSTPVYFPRESVHITHRGMLARLVWDSPQAIASITSAQLTSELIRVMSQSVMQIECICHACRAQYYSNVRRLRVEMAIQLMMHPILAHLKINMGQEDEHSVNVLLAALKLCGSNEPTHRQKLIQMKYKLLKPSAVKFQQPYFTIQTATADNSSSSLRAAAAAGASSATSSTFLIDPDQPSIGWWEGSSHMTSSGVVQPVQIHSVQSTLTPLGRFNEVNLQNELWRLVRLRGDRSDLSGQSISINAHPNSTHPLHDENDPIALLIVSQIPTAISVPNVTELINEYHCNPNLFDADGRAPIHNILIHASSERSFTGLRLQQFLELCQHPRTDVNLRTLPILRLKPTHMAKLMMGCLNAVPIQPPPAAGETEGEPLPEMTPLYQIGFSQFHIFIYLLRDFHANPLILINDPATGNHEANCFDPLTRNIVKIGETFDRDGVDKWLGIINTLLHILDSGQSYPIDWEKTNYSSFRYLDAPKQVPLTSSSSFSSSTATAASSSLISSSEEEILNIALGLTHDAIEPANPEPKASYQWRVSMDAFNNPSFRPKTAAATSSFSSSSSTSPPRRMRIYEILDLRLEVLVRQYRDVNVILKSAVATAEQYSRLTQPNIFRQLCHRRLLSVYQPLLITHLIADLANIVVEYLV